MPALHPGRITPTNTPPSFSSKAGAAPLVHRAGTDYWRSVRRHHKASLDLEDGVLPAPGCQASISLPRPSVDSPDSARLSCQAHAVVDDDKSVLQRSGRFLKDPGLTVRVARISGRRPPSRAVRP